MGDFVKVTWSDHWKVILLLSVIAIASFAVIFMMMEPEAGTETTELPMKEWFFQRPYPDEHVDIYETLNATFRDSDVNFEIALNMWTFIHSTKEVSGDYLRFETSIGGSSRSGIHLHSIEMVFRNDTQPSNLFFLRTSIEPTNLTLTTLKDASSTSSFEKARVKLVATNDSREVGFKSTVHWAFFDFSPDAEDHQMQVECTCLYYNGTAYKKIVQPFFLKILKSPQQ